MYSIVPDVSISFFMIRFLSLLSLSLVNITAYSQSQPSIIRLNQLGYYPNAVKQIAVLTDSAETFKITTPDRKRVVFTGKLKDVRKDSLSGKSVRLADFSSVTQPGKYVFVLDKETYSEPFAIKTNVYRPLATGSLKGFYYQRASTPLPAEFAGEWARAAGHPDSQVQVHPSAASDRRPKGTIISSPGGWYDAGDYNKYIVNSGITVGTLLSLLEDFPTTVKALKTNIPESDNALPDLLDETLWNLRWMLTMQDPSDGGVYHKLTNAKFDGMVMPDKATATRYVVQKSVTATLDFTAVMAQASRVLKPYERQLPGLADSCLQAAQRAWQWAGANPKALYDQDVLNKRYKPDIVTGAYGDNDASDEQIWAATELYITTKDDTYYKAIKLFPDDKTPLPSWAQVRTLAYYALVRNAASLTPLGKRDLPQVKRYIMELADRFSTGVDRQPYGTAMGQKASDFIWGSSAEAANQGIALLIAYKYTSGPNKKQYLRSALSNLDYLLGRNAVGYSFVTGFGTNTPLHPHHRPSVADGIEAPVPGLLSGGTNARAAQQDKCAGYTSTAPDEVYLDADCSYASNEIAINWNAPLVYLTTALEALQADQTTTSRTTKTSKGRSRRR